MRYILFFIVFAVFVQAQDADSTAIGIEHQKHLGDTIPMELEFTNFTGETHKLKDIIDKPTVLALVYYRCPGLCSPLMNNLGEVMDRVDLEAGKDYQSISISFDPDEDYKLAADKRGNYTNAMNTDIPGHAWRFMAGDSASIKKLTNSVGYHYQRADDGNWIHSGAVIVISPGGKITRYLMGTDYLPFDFKMAINEAKQGKEKPAITRLAEYCFSYDPEGGKYVFNITKVAATFILGGAGIFLIILFVKGRKKNKKDNNKEINNG